MTINEMRVELLVFCQDRENLEDPCENCPVNNIDNVCEDFCWDNAPEKLVEKAYRALKGEQTMNITADNIRKAALELINDMAQAADDIGKEFAIGYILGVGDLAKKVTDGENAEKDT